MLLRITIVRYFAQLARRAPAGLQSPITPASWPAASEVIQHVGGDRTRQAGRKHADLRRIHGPCPTQC